MAGNDAYTTRPESFFTICFTDDVMFGLENDDNARSFTPCCCCKLYAPLNLREIGVLIEVDNIPWLLLLLVLLVVL